MARYTVLASMKNEIEKKLKSIVNKCRKNNVPCTFEISEPYSKHIVDRRSKDTYAVSVCDIEIDAKLKFNGWTALGLVQRKDGITQCYFDDPSLIKDYCNTDFHCDHCMKRAHRNSIIVLENESGERKIVGTSCVKEFTCGLDGSLVAAFNDYARILSAKDSELRILMQGESLDDMPISALYDGNCVRTYSVERILSIASIIINRYGFEPSCSINATWKVVQEYLSDRSLTDIEDEAKDAILWIKSLSDEDLFKSQYLFNIRQVIDAGYCTARHFGLLVSLIPTYRKHLRIMSIESNKQVSDYVAKVGDKFSYELIYISTISYQSRFGTGFFHLFKDSNGNIFKWSTSNGKIPVDSGSKILVSGKIKAHEEYRNEKQTVLTRCKITSLV